jgi:hypothetical protein
VTLKLICTEPPTGIVGTAHVMVDPTMVRPDGSGVTTVANGSTFDRSSVAVAPDTGAPLLWAATSVYVIVEPGSTVVPDGGLASFVSSHTPAVAVLVIVHVAAWPSTRVIAPATAVPPWHVHAPAV